jgi:hypothetical protein
MPYESPSAGLFEVGRLVQRRGILHRFPRVASEATDRSHVATPYLSITREPTVAGPVRKRGILLPGSGVSETQTVCLHRMDCGFGVRPVSSLSTDCQKTLTCFLLFHLAPENKMFPS